MKFLIGSVIGSILGAVWGQVAPTSDPATTFTSLGAAGLVAVAIYFWQRDTAKQRDKAMDVLATLSNGLNDLRQSVEKSNEAHLASAKATQEMTRALEKVPPSETWYRLVSTLERIERNRGNGPTSRS